MNNTGDFLSRWGWERGDLLPPVQTSMGDLIKIACIQFVAVVLIMYVVRPSCTLIKDAPHTAERFNVLSAVAIAFIVTVITLCHPRGVKLG